MIVRGSWPYDDEGGGRDPGQVLAPVALAFVIVLAATILAALVVLALKRVV